MPRSKRYQDLKKQINQDKFYPIAEAINLVKKTSSTKFDASVEVHIRLGINATKGDQQVRGNITLPHGTGKTKKVAAFVIPASEKAAAEAGADLVGGKELINKIRTSGKCEFDVAVAEPDMMKELSAIAKILGPKGLMPSPKSNTVTKDIKKVVNDLKKGMVNFKNDDSANIHLVIGKVSFDSKKLEENYNTLLTAVNKEKPRACKGIYIHNISLSSSMGPGVKVEINR